MGAASAMAMPCYEQVAHMYACMCMCYEQVVRMYACMCMCHEQVVRALASTCMHIHIHIHAVLRAGGARSRKLPYTCIGCIYA